MDRTYLFKYVFYNDDTSLCTSWVSRTGEEQHSKERPVVGVAGGLASP